MLFRTGNAYPSSTKNIWDTDIVNLAKNLLLTEVFLQLRKAKLSVLVFEEHHRCWWNYSFI